MADLRFSEVVGLGDRLRSLEALRDLLAVALEVCDSNRDRAALAQRLTDVLAQIEAAGGSGNVGDPEDETFDELARRRAARGSDTPRAEPS